MVKNWMRRLREMKWDHHFPEERITVTIDLGELTAMVEETRQRIEDVMNLYDTLFGYVKTEITRIDEDIRYIKDHYRYFEGKEHRTIMNLYRKHLE